MRKPRDFAVEMARKVDFNDKGKVPPLQASRAKQKRRHCAASSGKNPSLFLCVFLAEFIDAARGVQHLLLSGIERMALRAHFDMQVAAHGGAGLELVTAAASN
jgi:hypothetical protein